MRRMERARMQTARCWLVVPPVTPRVAANGGGGDGAGWAAAAGGQLEQGQRGEEVGGGALAPARAAAPRQGACRMGNPHWQHLVLPMQENIDRTA